MSDTKKFGRLPAREAARLGYIPAIVLLDGERMPLVYDLDDIEGWIEQYDSKDGRPYLDEKTKDVAVLPRKYGEVVYIPNPEHKSVD